MIYARFCVISVPFAAPMRALDRLDRKFNRGGRSIGPGPLPREQRGAGFGATATAPVRLAGGSACGPDG